MPALPSPRGARFKVESRAFWQVAGGVLRQARDDAGLTRREVIRRVSGYLGEEQALSVPTLKRIEAGTTSPDGYLVALLCDLYGVPRMWPYRATQSQSTGGL